MPALHFQPLPISSVLPRPTTCPINLPPRVILSPLARVTGDTRLSLDA